MAKIFHWLATVLSALVIAGCIAIFILFILTTVGLTPQEQVMLSMTSVQINQMHMQASSILSALQTTGNYTDKLLILNNNLVAINAQQASNIISTQVLREDAAQNEMELLAYNATIESQMFIIQLKIDNVTVPTVLNLTLNATTTSLVNGTVIWFNPNNQMENTTLNYTIAEQLGNTFIEIGPVGSSFMYSTIGGMAWTTLGFWDPPIFLNNTVYAVNGTGQILDDQRNKIMASPLIDSREYVPNENEIRLVFGGAVGGAQPVMLNEEIEMNVGFV